MQCDSQRHSQSAAPSTSILLDEWVRSWLVRDLGAGETELVSDFAWGFGRAPIRNRNVRKSAASRGGGLFEGFPCALRIFDFNKTQKWLLQSSYGVQSVGSA